MSATVKRLLRPYLLAYVARDIRQSGHHYRWLRAQGWDHNRSTLVESLIGRRFE
jgi:hypothetical protein